MSIDHRRRGPIAQALSLVAVLGLTASPAQAADDVAPKVITDVTRCRRIAEPQARLACLDAAAAALEEATTARSIVVLDRAEVKKTRRSLFGFALPRLPFFGNDRGENGSESADAEAVRELDTTITQASPYGHGLWTLALAEGGTWRTTETSRTFDPSRGDKLTIKRGGLGNYLATFGRSGSIRVERVR